MQAEGDDACLLEFWSALFLRMCHSRCLCRGEARAQLYDNYGWEITEILKYAYTSATTKR